MIASCPLIHTEPGKSVFTWCYMHEYIAVFSLWPVQQESLTYAGDQSKHTRSTMTTA